MKATKLELTRNEREYLADKTFWDWKRAGLDVDFYRILASGTNTKGVRKLQKINDFYKNLYHKLRGEE